MQRYFRYHIFLFFRSGRSFSRLAILFRAILYYNKSDKQKYRRLREMALSIKPYIENKERIHLIGIGGVSMNSLGELLLSRGVPISGSDRLRMLPHGWRLWVQRLPTSTSRRTSRVRRSSCAPLLCMTKIRRLSAPMSWAFRSWSVPRHGDTSCAIMTTWSVWPARTARQLPPR